MRLKQRSELLREGRLEWCQVKGWARQGLRNIEGQQPEHGWIPRYVLEEEFKIDCSPLDDRDAWGKQGTVWFSKEQAEAIHKHPLFDTEFSA